MRNTVLGVALSLLFIIGLFALPRFFPHEGLQLTPMRAAAGIEPGFRGTRRIGPWTLVCGPAHKKAVPIPFSLGARGSLAVDAQDLGRCRTFIAFRRKADPKKIALLVNFRVMGKAQRLAVFIRMPPIAKKGQTVTVQAGKQALSLPISACEPGSCLAGGVLIPKQELLFYARGGVELLLPQNSDGKRPALHLPFWGLRAAADAMRRAQAGEPA